MCGWAMGWHTWNMYPNSNIMSGSINQYLSPKLNSADYATRKTFTIGFISVNITWAKICHAKRKSNQKKLCVSLSIPENAQQNNIFSVPLQNITSLLCSVDCSAMVKAIYESFMPLTIPAGIHNRPFLIWHTYK